jgi:hypothetical protein
MPQDIDSILDAAEQQEASDIFLQAAFPDLLVRISPWVYVDTREKGAVLRTKTFPK